MGPGDQKSFSRKCGNKSADLTSKARILINKLVTKRFAGTPGQYLPLVVHAGDGFAVERVGHHPAAEDIMEHRLWTRATAPP